MKLKDSSIKSDKMVKYITLIAAIFGVLGIGQSLPCIPDETTEKVFPIPQKNGSFSNMTQSEAALEASLAEFPALSLRTFDKVRFFLYTHESPTKPVEIDKDDPETLVRSTFKSQNPTRFMVHGWNGGYNISEVRLIRDALLLRGNDTQYNFIAVDWSVYAESSLYISSQKSVSKTGKIVAEFIDWMHDNAKLSFEKLALYGHSLGAHVVGFAGKKVQRGKIHTIIGLDPAMPLFNYDNSEGRLAETDAKYVESIHTNGGMLGFYQPIGRASFYPNGGKNQPGCGLDIGCAHARSVEYLSEALALSKENGFYATKCKDFEDVKNASCTINTFRVRLGDPNNARYARGVYYLETNRKPPYGLKGL